LRVGKVLEHVIEDNAIEGPVGQSIGEGASDYSVEPRCRELGSRGVGFDPPDLDSGTLALEELSEASGKAAHVEYRASRGGNKRLNVRAVMVLISAQGADHRATAIARGIPIGRSQRCWRARDQGISLAPAPLAVFLRRGVEGWFGDTEKSDHGR